MSERRSHLLFVALIAAALIGTALLAIPGSPVHRSPTLGLDLQGGFEVILEADPEEGQQLQDADLDRSVEIIRNRVDKLGVSEPTVTKQGSNQISVEMPGVDDPNRVRRIIGSTAKLELYDLTPALTNGPSIDPQGFTPIPSENLYDLLGSSRTRSLVNRDAKEAGPFYLYRAKGKQLIAGPMPTERALRATDAAREAGVTADKLPKTLRIFAVPAKTVIVTCDDSATVCPGLNRETQAGDNFLYLFKYDPEAKELEDRFPQMTGSDLKLDGTRQDFDTQTGQPIVTMQFTDEGADKFHDVTRNEAQLGRSFFNRLGQGADPDNFNQSFAIVLDREIKSFPSIDFETYPDGISGNNGAQITGLDSLTEAKDLALVLQTGALPVEFKTLSETQISATLGEDSLREALRAAIAGLLLVAVFLLIAYRFLGLVAVLGLGIYAALLYAAILIFNVTLTLPGFAGMILTIGVAADANIVIFERIKEESRAGKTVKAAIGAGYGKGFSTIIDANVVTAITALVLFALATAGVKGFALMLLIGTAMSLVTAVFATRAMLGLLANFSWFNSPRFMGAQGNQIASWIQHDYIGKRRIWFAISGAVLVISAASLAVKQLNLGIDFEGGTKVTFSTPRPNEVEDVRAQAARIGEEGAQIQGVGEETDDGFTEFQMRTESLSPAELNRLSSALANTLDVDRSEISSTNVSASFGRQIAESAIYAILFSLLLVVGYISFRFQWKFAIAVIVAMLHDVVIAIGIYSLIGAEVTTATVAAFLTVLGYSIYDTIIILDRVRENLPLMRRASIRTIANVSLWETIRRSLATTFITLLPLSALYFFGGETLKGFAFALLVGIGSGAYSSIFIAAPLVAWLKEREPEWARRKEQDEDGAVDAVTAAELEAATVLPADVEPEAVPALPTPAPPPVVSDGAKRERRRQRRRARPHGRAR